MNSSIRPDRLHHLVATLSFGLLAASAGVAGAQVPTSLQQQGRLLEDDGTPASGEVELQFTIYDAKTGGSVLWQGVETVEVDESGYYTATLGNDENPLDPTVLESGPRWLGVAVSGENEMTPRTKLHSVPYATLASRAESVADAAVTSDAIAEGAISSDSIDSLAWGKIDGIPPSIADGDDDTLAGLGCSEGQIARYDGSKWNCSEDRSALDDLNCSTGEVVTSDGSGGWQCKRRYSGEDFAVSDQSCPDGQVAIGIDASGELNCQNRDNWVDETGDAMSGNLDMQGRNLTNVGTLNPGVGVTRRCTRWDSDGDPHNREDGFNGSGVMNTLKFPDKKGQLIFVQASYAPGDWGGEADGAYMWVQVDGNRVTNKLPQISDSNHDGNMNTGNPVMGFYVGDGGDKDVIEQYKKVTGGDMAGDGWATLCAYALPVGGG